MPNPWFRLYSEFADDPKVQMMSESMQRRLVMLMCSKCKGETLQKLELAFQWRVSEAEVEETRLLFIQKGFIGNDWNLLNWNKRQFISDSSTDRVRRFREGKKQDETLHETDETNGTVSVTPPEQNRTDTEQNKKEQKRIKLPLATELPEWLPREVWDQFVQSRADQKKPLNRNSERLALKELTKLYDEGYEPVPLVEAAVMAGWLRFYVRDDSPKRKKVYVVMSQAEIDAANERDFGVKVA